MGFLSPIAALIAAGITVPALVALYFLKLRRRQMVVSSTLLWKKAVQDMQVNAPFQKMRRNLLLLLQLLILAALLLAMARPTLMTTADPGQRVIVVIDRSASMNATDVSPTRLDEAKRAALDLVDNLDVGGRMMIVTYAQNARVVQQFTSDTSQLRSRINGIEPTDQISNIAPALELVENWAQQAADDADESGLKVYVISDGRVHQQPGEALSLQGAELIYLRMGSDDPADYANVGIVAFSARRDFERPHIVQIFARLTYRGPEPVQFNVTLTVDGQVQAVEPLAMPGAMDEAPASRSVQFDFVLPDAAMLELSHDFDDVMPADNTARMVLAPARRLRVLLVTEGNAFLYRVIESVGIRNLVQMTPARYENQNPQQLIRGGWDRAALGGDEGFDVLVFDGYAPQQVPPVNSLYLGAIPPIDDLIMRPPRETDPQAQPVLDWHRSHPILRYVVLDDVVIASPDRLVLPDDAEVLATAQTGPIMATLTRDGVRHVFASFNILNSNWPLYVSFPVFFSNSLQQLGLGSLADEAGLHYRTGQVAAISLTAADRAPTWEGPVRISSNVVRTQAVLEPFTRVGVYTSGDQYVEEPFNILTVNLLDPVESDTMPADILEVGTRSLEGQSRNVAIRREIWRPILLWAALPLLLLEWLIYTRRMHI